MGSHVLSPVGGIVRGFGHSNIGFSDPRSCWGIGHGASGYDDHGRDQPYGVGMLSEIHRKRPFGTLADNGDTSSKAP